MTLKERILANSLLSEIHLATGDLDRAVGYAYVAKLIQRYGPDAPWAQDHLVEEADEFELLATAYCELGEHAINFGSDFQAAAELAQRREQLHVEYERWLASTPADRLFLSVDWVRNIGHIALLDYWVKLRHLGWLGRSRIVIHAPPRFTANRTYLNYFKPHLKIVTDPTPGGATRHLAATFGPRVASVLRLPGHPDRYFLEGMGVIQEEWERQGRGPLLALSDNEEVAGRAKLQELGIPEGAWFVALHVRSPGFYKEQKSLPHQTHRNADIATYLPLIGVIVSQGGWVVRMGDPSMPALSPTPGVVDYAIGPHKSEWMDVFLIARCRFFVGVASGLSQIPVTFGIPSLFTNWMSNALPVNSRHDLFIPKRVWSDRQNRLLTFEEWLNPINRSHYIAATEMRRAGLREFDNTPEELHEAVTEMLDRLDSLARYDRADDDRRELFEGIARRHGLVGFARIGRDFLRRHQHLLPQVEQRREAG
jgi:putative glycosyltransferase (TIGR04372 family)